MQCCAECFGDPGLRKAVIPVVSTVTGKCPLCATDAQELADAEKLRDNFELVTSIYVPDETGKPLVDWMIDDWRLFKHPKFDRDKARALLAAILENAAIVDQRFKPADEFAVDTRASWENLRLELKRRNRFFPHSELDLKRLGVLLGGLRDNTSGRSDWFRARISDEGKLLRVPEMGAPPYLLAKHGRANPTGIPYLYVGSSREMAVAEVRPYPGELVCIAAVSIDPSVKLIDLRNPRPLLSPFLYEDANEVGLLRRDIGLLEQLGLELKTPVLQSSAAIDYIPSQYLCEFIKNEGYDGVLYASSVGDGVNLALFDPERAQVGEIDLNRVSGVDIKLTPVEAG